MDIDDTTPGTVDESAYIGDNCLSTPVSIWHKNLLRNNFKILTVTVIFNII